MENKEQKEYIITEWQLKRAIQDEVRNAVRSHPYDPAAIQKAEQRIRDVIAELERLEKISEDLANSRTNRDSRYSKGMNFAYARAIALLRGKE